VADHNRDDSADAAAQQRLPDDPAALRVRTAARHPGRSLIGLSTTSVYPQATSSTFELASRLGYDGIELMVGIDSVSTDIDSVERLRDHHQVPVLSVHAPCLLLTQRVWGTDNWAKLERSAAAAAQLGADVVVVHPPFRWQRDYGTDFLPKLKALRQRTGIRFCLENMYPWRVAGSELRAYVPHWDPTGLDYDDLTLDISHASSAGQQSRDLVRAWGSRLGHLHLTDGTGGAGDEHLVPGRGDQHADLVLEDLAAAGYTGHVVCEVTTRKLGSRAEREEDLAASLAFARKHLTAGGQGAYAVDSTGVASLV
jgi:sugar phosphate isomerase/epimerase